MWRSIPPSPAGKNDQCGDVEHTGDAAAVEQLRQHGIGEISFVAAPHGVEGGRQIHTGIPYGDEDAEKRAADDGEDRVGLADQQAEHQQHGQGRDDADLEMFADPGEDGIELGRIGYARALLEPDDRVQDNGDDIGGRDRIHHMADMPEQRNPADRSGHIGGIGEGGKLIAEERTADNGGRGNTGIKAEAGANPHDGKADRSDRTP